MDEEMSGIGREVERMKNRIADHRDRQLARVARDASVVRAAADKAKRVHRKQTRRLASNLHRIIEACCSPASKGPRVAKKDLADEAGMADGNRKSSRLYPYTLPGDLAEPAATKRRGRLSTVLDGYLRLVSAASKLSGQSEDDLLLQLVEGTCLTDCLAGLPDTVEPDHLDMLVAAIRGEARRISDALGLPWFFATVDGHCLVRHGDGWATNWQEPDIAESIPVLWLQTEELGAFDATWAKRGEDGKLGAPEPCTGLICSRVGICLAPFGEGRKVAPCIVRRYVTVAVGHRPSHEAYVRLMRAEGKFAFPDLTIPEVLEPPAWRQPGLYSRRGALRPVDPQAMTDIIASLGDEYGRDEYEEVTPSSLLRHVEGVPAPVALVPGDVLHCTAEAFTKSPAGSRMQSFEIALLHGAGEEMHGEAVETIGQALEGVLTPLVESLQAWTYEQGARIDERLAEMASPSPKAD